MQTAQPQPIRPITATITFRPATKDDLPFLVACAEEAYAQYVEAIGKKPAPMVFDFAAHLGAMETEVIFLENEQAGFIVWEWQPDCLFLDNIAVSGSALGKGLARKAVDHLKAKALDAGRQAIELYTNEKMTANLSLYAHLGFAETERRSEHGFNRVYFRKAL